MANNNSKSVMLGEVEAHRPRNATERSRRGQGAALAAACTAIGLLAGSSAHSQPADATADSHQLVEIPVTGQRHVENVQKDLQAAAEAARYHRASGS